MTLCQSYPNLFFCSPENAPAPSLNTVSGILAELNSSQSQTEKARAPNPSSSTLDCDNLSWWQIPERISCSFSSAAQGAATGAATAAQGVGAGAKDYFSGLKGVLWALALLVVVVALAWALFAFVG
jgi:hypothetical protein